MSDLMMGKAAMKEEDDSSRETIKLRFLFPFIALDANMNG
jgi:hypothetical protein